MATRDLTGAVVAVVGANGGLGRAITATLTGRGATVVRCTRSGGPDSDVTLDLRDARAGDALVEHIAATSAINDSLLQAYRASLKQLNVPEWSFANAFVGELIMVDPIFPDTYDLFNGAALVSQNAATKNLMYVSYYKPWTTISSLSPEAYFELLQKCQNEQVTEPRCLLDMEAKINPVTILYNPFGKMMASFTHIGFKNYLSRVHDLNGLILLINAQLSLKVSGAELSQQAVDALSYKNPYTNEPFQWNETTRQLSFICIGDKPFCSITL